MDSNASKRVSVQSLQRLEILRQAQLEQNPQLSQTSQGPSESDLEIERRKQQEQQLM